MPYREETRICHVCKTMMDQIIKKTAHVDRCQKCKHTFFDAGELAQLAPEGAALEANIADHSNPHLHCNECQQSILEASHCPNPPDRSCPGCGAALFVVYALPCDLEFCRKCKGIVVEDKALEKAIHENIELSRVQIFSEEERATLSSFKKVEVPAGSGWLVVDAFLLIASIIAS